MKSQLSRYLIVLLTAFFMVTGFTLSFADVSENPDAEIIDTTGEEESSFSDAQETEDIQEPTETLNSDFEEPEQENAATSVDAIDSQSAVYYTVKKGDTLWDLSKRFNNDAWQWPGVWGKNSQLKNPHIIYPGQRIKLFSRSDIEQVKKLEVQAEEDIVETTETVEEAPDFVEPVDTDKTVENVQPLDIEPTPELATEAEKPVSLPFYRYSPIESTGFMKKKPVKANGYVFKVKGPAKIMLSKGDEIYVKESKGFSLTPGAKYYTYQVLAPRFIKKQLKKNRVLGGNTRKVKVGSQHLITGVIEVTGKKSGYVLARIIRSFRTVRLQDYIMPYVKRSPEIMLASSVEGLNGRIITSESHESLFGDSKVAFIDKGASHGVKIGQMYNVFYPEEKDSAQFIGGDDLFVPVDFASFIILHAEENTATVLITSAYKGISAGDKWHYPQD